MVPLWLSAQDTALVTRYFIGTKIIYQQFSVLKADTTIMHGSYRTYHYRGQPAVVGQYDHGQRDGHWQSYYENGKVESDVHYCMARYCDVWTYYTYEGLVNGRFDMEHLITRASYDTVASYSTFGDKVSREINYPDPAREADISGTTTLLISRDSACQTHYYIASGFDRLCDAEALRATRKMLEQKNFLDCDGKPFFIPIRFWLAN